MNWLTENLDILQKLGGLWVAVGIISLLLTLIALPLIVIRLPVDYFVREKRVTVASRSTHPFILLIVSATKNVVGVVLIIFGAIMLFVPGQGILTMLIGLMLTNFPGKYRLERRLVRRPAVLRALNRVRDRAGRDPLMAP